MSSELIARTTQKEHPLPRQCRSDEFGKLDVPDCHGGLYVRWSLLINILHDKEL